MDDPFIHESTRSRTCMKGSASSSKRFKVSRSFKRTDVGTLMHFASRSSHSRSTALAKLNFMYRRWYTRERERDEKGELQTHS